MAPATDVAYFYTIILSHHKLPTFPETTTGADGKATISIPLGESQTTWRILAYASTADTKLGQGELDFLVAR